MARGNSSAVALATPSETRKGEARGDEAQDGRDRFAALHLNPLSQLSVCEGSFLRALDEVPMRVALGRGRLSATTAPVPV